MADAKKTDDLGQSEAQKKADEELEAGLRGDEVDQTPNEHYTVPGVLAGKPTPETDDKQAAKATEGSGS